MRDNARLTNGSRLGKDVVMRELDAIQKEFDAPVEMESRDVRRQAKIEEN